ncbi:hypothetical protein TFKS16_2388 [Tannerella forsythia KS16]|nr:hypothetical protein TFKS16_2388 [Tannerella forsythia KS16]
MCFLSSLPGFRNHRPQRYKNFFVLFEECCVFVASIQMRKETGTKQIKNIGFLYRVLKRFVSLRKF